MQQCSLRFHGPIVSALKDHENNRVTNVKVATLKKRGEIESAERPQTAAALHARLVAIFPGFCEECTDAEVAESENEGGPAMHLVMQRFAVYFGCEQDSLSPRQIVELAELANEAVTVDDVLENAFGTCFLEHLHQIDGYKTLAPHLSAKAKSECRA